MSVQSEIDRLVAIKSAMKSAINGSGSTVGDKFADYPPAVTNGRAGIAAAITEKGVQTSADAPFDVLEANVRAIKSGPGFDFGDTAIIKVNNSAMVAVLEEYNGEIFPKWYYTGGGESIITLKNTLFNCFPDLAGILKFSPQASVEAVNAQEGIYRIISDTTISVEAP